MKQRRDEVIASGLRGSSSRRAGVPSVERSILRAGAVEVPSGPEPIHMRGHPSGDNRRSKRIRDQAALTGAQRRAQAVLHGQLSPLLVKHPVRGQAPIRSLTGIYAFNASCRELCKSQASLRDFHGLVCQADWRMRRRPAPSGSFLIVEGALNTMVARLSGV